MNFKIGDLISLQKAHKVGSIFEGHEFNNKNLNGMMQSAEIAIVLGQHSDWVNVYTSTEIAGWIHKNVIRTHRSFLKD
jgi:hypothetical protein